MKTLVTVWFAVIGGLMIAAVVASPVRADENSYLDYLRSHGYGLSIGPAIGPAIGPNSPQVGTGIIPFPEQTIADGQMLCNEYRSGSTVEQSRAKHPSPYFDQISDAARSELCPEVK